MSKESVTKARLSKQCNYHKPQDKETEVREILSNSRFL